MDAVRLLDDVTFETLDRFEFAEYEMCTRVGSMSFDDDKNVYYVASTAIAVPEEQEPSKASHQNESPKKSP